MTTPTNTTKTSLKHKRRYCRTPGCHNIVKSQGLCQRHGAKPRMCKVPNCPKQAQGNFDGMCKAHFKAHKRSTVPLPARDQHATEPPPPQGVSVYESIIPASIAWRHSSSSSSTLESTTADNNTNKNTNKPLMPLVAHLKAGFDNPHQPPAWHRNEERRARGLWPVYNPATQLESWERELVWTEVLLLTGNPEASFRHLARAWGRDKGFHSVLAQFICERHGNVERKKRQAQGNTNNSNTPVDVMGQELLQDEAMYGGNAYNEALAADLFHFADVPLRTENTRMLSFEQQQQAAVDNSVQEQGVAQEPQHPVTDEYEIPFLGHATTTDLVDTATMEAV